MSIPYTDSRIVKLGRWIDTGSGLLSGWGSAQLRFKVSGCTSFTVTAGVSCNTGKLCILESVVDNNPENSTVAFFANNENFSGFRTITVNLPDTAEHDVILKTAGYNGDIFSGASYSVITQITLGSGGVLSAPNLGPKMVQCVGDSWMAAEADWPRLMDPSIWKPYQIATGGLTVIEMDSQYEYTNAGNLATDPAADIVIVSFGVNDYNVGLSGSTYQSYLLSIVDKIQTHQSCPVVLIQTPRHGSSHYDQYGANMSAIAGMRSNVNYVSTADLWSTLTWQSDGAHLDAAGKTILADFMDAKLKEILGLIVPGVRISGNEAECHVVPTNDHYLRINGLGVVLPTGIHIK